MHLTREAGMTLAERTVPDLLRLSDMGELVFQRCGPHLLVRLHDENAWETSVLTGYPAPPGSVVVLASAGAHRSAGLTAALATAVSVVLSPDWLPGRPDRVWFAVSGAGRWPWLRQLADQHGVEVLAPQGRLTLVPGGTLFVTSAIGPAGWLCHRPGRPDTTVSARYPLPAWDPLLPHSPGALAGLRADPVPAGLVLCAATDPPTSANDLAYAVPVDPERPRLILGRAGGAPPAPDGVATAVRELHPLVRGTALFVPTSPAQLRAEWVRALADGIGNAVLLSAGMPRVDNQNAATTITFADNGDHLFRPFATVLRAAPGAPGVEVAGVAEAPAGWSRTGDRGYRYGGGTTVADVVPSGLVLRDAVDTRPDPVGSFDPARWTLAVGVPGQPVTAAVCDALLRLLGGLSVDQVRSARIRVDGEVGDAVRNSLRALADYFEIDVDARFAAVPSALQSAAQTVVHRMIGDLPALATTAETVRIPAPAAAPPVPEPPVRTSVPSPVTESRPVTVSEPPVPTTVAWPATESTAGQVIDRPSTAEERTRFVEWAGVSFTEALATVNSALATWPALRQQDLRMAKVDYAAVCLYLRTDLAGRLDTNSPSFTPCLASGLRRLPMYRRPVLRQGGITGGVATDPTRYYPVGAVLTEPEFLDTTSAIDVSVPDTDVDFLIWPRFGRRTAALDGGRADEQIVFVAGTAFKVLAVRRVTDAAPVASLPSVAVLLREVPAGTADAALDDEDKAVLARLDGTLLARHSGPVRVLDDPGLGARLAATLVGVPTVMPTVRSTRPS